ncbi:phage tail assembly chaperone G [Dickeya fangzhongdai]|uniref:phage tail assembly chaperone G n=1 Tax=Dickeya fangzhongdai TaxID=1778540 RepID=UPI001ADA26AB|nr:phage minor tail protein G [Dickeya fangzhongdai]MBO8132457.1 phage minor tail protein G [Dickeya fangzhongdai]
MFLNNEEIEIGSTCITLNELSGLQRIEYLEYITGVQKSLKEWESLPDDERLPKALRVNVEVNAWLISRSLWHNDRNKSVDALRDEIMQQWSVENITAAGNSVLKLSGMLTENTDSDEDKKSDVSAVTGPEYPEGKY